MAGEQLHDDNATSKTYQGVPLKEIPTLFDQSLNLSDMQDVSNGEHSFLIKPFKYDSSKAECEPETENGMNNYIDMWDDDHARMPCSSFNVTHKGTLKWLHIQNILTELKQKCEMNNATTSDMKKAIENCNGTKFDIGSLEYLINKIYSEEERIQFMSVILPNIIFLAINVDKICGQAPRKLRIHSNHSLTISQRQASALLSCAFFCLFPSDSSKHTNYEHPNYQSINFNHLFRLSTPWKVEKLKCILHYFRRITENMPKGVITFQRTALSDDIEPKWLQSEAPLCKVHIDSKGTIEDMHGLLQVDFANMYIGGGVMDEGRVQEEIRFTICPEMLVSILVCEVMQSNECIFLIGCEQFTTYDGYCDTFQMKDNYIDNTTKDDWGRKRCHVVAIDATYFGNHTVQYTVKSMVRELIKAYVGFRLPKTFEHLKYGIATGNWGCGAFNGDLQLKALIQLIAASQANRLLVYLTFNDQDLVASFWHVYQYLVDQQATVGDLYVYLQEFSSRYQQISLFDFILSRSPPLKTTV